MRRLDDWQRSDAISTRWHRVCFACTRQAIRLVRHAAVDTMLPAFFLCAAGQPVFIDPSPPPPIHENILGTIGQTPLVRLRRTLQNNSVNLFAKLEAFNPGGSAKDRPALAMIEAALRSGLLSTDSTVVESSSGNMGIGLAQACRYHSLRFICVVDPHAQSQNLAIIKAYGGEIETIDRPIDGSFLNARLRRVRELVDKIPNSYWPNQYANLANPQSHAIGTIREIDQHFGDSLDYVYVATSSTGTARGCQQFLRSRGRKARVIAVDAHGSVLFGGTASPRHIPGLGAGRMPELAAGQRFDGLHRVTDLDCVIGCRRTAAREAILVGGSGGGVIEAIRRDSRILTGKNVVAVLHDSGTRYLDTVYSDDWVQEKLGVAPEVLNQLINHGQHSHAAPIGCSHAVA